jgi:dTDP-4-dehydrorhamnose reductase
MKIGITDSRGRLGKVLSKKYPEVSLSDVHEFDVIIHNGAFTDVDACETAFMKALVSNVFLTSRLRAATKAKIVYLSTDFIFDGTSGPYKENSVPGPLSVYGWTKLLGERSLYATDTIVRTTVLYGGYKIDFVTWVIKHLRIGLEFSVSDKSITSPTNVYHLEEAISYLITQDIQVPVVNVVGNTVLSKYDFARKIAKIWGYDDKTIQCGEVFRPAKRPELAGLTTSLAQELKIPIYSLDSGLKLMKERYEAIYSSTA